jgi:hypothetical protein
MMKRMNGGRPFSIVMISWPNQEDPWHFGDAMVIDIKIKDSFQLFYV